MTSTRKTIFRLGAALLAMGLAGGTAGANQQIRTVYSPSQLREDAGAALSRHLRTLADSPRSLTALVGAGEAALALDDPQTALTFFARAEEVAPRDGRVKAGMGSAFVLMEQPEAALRFFGEAVSFGIPEYRFAGDRGLAYDLTGDPRRAQADYRLALGRQEDAEVRQRLALSLAITGDRDGALKTIEDLVRRQDRSAWRTRAFILALTGDTAGATEATRAVLPAQAAAMQPFYARLPWLSPAERANAVHFGRFPDDSRSAQGAAAGGQTQYAGAAPATRNTAQTADARRQPASSEPRRRPGAGNRTRTAADSRSARTTATRTPRQTQTAPASQTQQTRPANTEPEPYDPAPARSTEANPAFSSQAAAQSATPASRPEPRATREPQPKPEPQPKREPKAQPAKSAASAPAKEPPKVVRLPFGPPTPGTPPRLADIGKAVETVPAAAKSEDKPEKVAEPRRHWVQIAGGANKTALPREFDRLKERAPELLSGKTAWTTPLRFTNRLLVGPFGSESEAQAFVNQLTAKDLSAFSWTSEEGQEIEKLPLR